jgi:diguanylate cyclase (GGDEF)-like protein/PAS domain S-box-containing protein
LVRVDPRSDEPVVGPGEAAGSTTYALRARSTGAPVGSASTAAFAELIDPLLLDGLLEQVDEVLVVLDRDDVVVYVSGGVFELLGHDPHDVVGREVRDFVASGVTEETLDRVGQARGGQSGTRVRARTASGGERDLLVLAGHRRGMSERGYWTLALRPAGTDGHLDAIRHRLAFEDLLARVSARIVERPAPEVDGAIREVLAEIGRFARVDRAYLYLAGGSGGPLTATHLWSADGVATRPARWHRLHGEDVGHWMALLAGGEPVYVSNPGELPAHWVGERAFMDDGATLSMLAVPVADRGRLGGFLAFDSVRADRLWNDDHLALLQSTANLIGQALARRDAEERLALAFDRAPLGIAVLSVDGRHLEVNDAYGELFDRDAETLRDVSLADLVEQRDRVWLLERHRQMVEGRANRAAVELRVPRAGHGVVWLRLHVAAVRDEHQQLQYMLAHAEDITLRHLQELELRSSEERYRTLVENSPAIVARFDGTGRLVYLSPSFEHRAPGSGGRVSTDPMDVLGAAQRTPAWADAIDQVVATGARVDWEWVVEINGVQHWFQSRAVPELGAGDVVEHVLVMNTDITALKRSEAELAHQAMHDPLTGLPNRALLEETLAALLRSGACAPGSLAVMFCDLDRFKLVNDSLGHTAGDHLLSVVSTRLVEVVPETATVARLGGDEFVVLLPDTRRVADALGVADRIHAALGEAVHIADTELRPTASIGLALLDPSHNGPAELLRDADAAMYLAKARGRHRTELCDEDLRDRASRRLEREGQLRRSFDLDEFEVHYQAEVEIPRPDGSAPPGRIVGVEALARWNHPGGGLVEAGSFIELAEETGLILALGSWVLHEACREVGRWHREDPSLDLTLRVNLSPRQLAQRDLVDDVAAALAEGGLAASSLCLEITETALMDDPERGLAVLVELHEMGVALAVDDFGTGYSSLAQLKRFPVDVVKVDRSFVSGLGVDAGDTAIVAAIVSMARAFDLEVVAEGVETELQLAELCRLGCSRAQGYLLGRPAPAGVVRRAVAG